MTALPPVLMNIVKAYAALLPSEQLEQARAAVERTLMDVLTEQPLLQTHRQLGAVRALCDWACFDAFPAICTRDDRSPPIPWVRSWDKADYKISERYGWPKQRMDLVHMNPQNNQCPCLPCYINRKDANSQNYFYEHFRRPRGGPHQELSPGELGYLKTDADWLDCTCAELCGPLPRALRT